MSDSEQNKPEWEKGAPGGESVLWDPWLVVFDLDGTLIDSSLDLCRSVNAALQHVGASPLNSQIITSFIGDGAAMLVQRALGCQVRDSVHQTALRFFLDFYRAHKLDTTRPYPHVVAGLERIRALAPALLMAVLTNKPVRPSREICDALGLSSFFFEVLGGDSLATKKPDPEGLLRLMTQARDLVGDEVSTSQLTADRVVLVGDSEVDVFTARHAGAKSLGCLYGLAPEKLLASRPDRLCASAAEWPERLGLQPESHSIG